MSHTGPTTLLLHLLNENRQPGLGNSKLQWEKSSPTSYPLACCMCWPYWMGCPLRICLFFASANWSQQKTRTESLGFKWALAEVCSRSLPLPGRGGQVSQCPVASKALNKEVLLHPTGLLGTPEGGKFGEQQPRESCWGSSSDAL